MSRRANIAIVGAQGLVGSMILDILTERHFPVGELRLGATARSAGHKVIWQDRSLVVQEVDAAFFTGLDFVFFAATNEASQKWAPVAIEQGAICIDKSSAFRLDPAVPLVVPEVNGEQLQYQTGLVASPNCSTIQLVMALKPLLNIGIESINVSTYQATSGTGREAIEELQVATGHHLAGEPFEPTVYPVNIAFNVLPQCDAFGADGYTKEEWKLILETRKILQQPDLKITATAARVPVAVGHSEAVHLTLAKEISLIDLRQLLSEMPGVVVLDERAPAGYPTPLQVAGKDEVYIGRIRKDLSKDRSYHLWVVADNLRKGAATNAIQIAEELWSVK